MPPRRLDNFAAYSIARLLGVFERDAGRPIEFAATGFWLRTNDDHLLFITNKHNVDPKLKHGAGTRFSLAKLDLQVRVPAANLVDARAAFHNVENLAPALWVADSADCAFVADPLLAGAAGIDRARIFKEENLAEPALFSALQITDAASFIGFPGYRGKPWWDQAVDLPIARHAGLSSIPSIAFTNDEVKTGDTLLVSGLSFSGSSGSPVINERKGIPPGGDILDKSFVPSKIIGIMSGHFWEDPESGPEMFRHSGLSYLTRSTSIIELIGKARATEFRKA